MSTRKTRTTRRPAAAETPNPIKNIGSVLSTVGGPSTSPPDGGAVSSHAKMDGAARLARQRAGSNKLAAAAPSNPLKAADHGLDAGHAPHAGVAIEPEHAEVSASTVSEQVESAKLGAGEPKLGSNPNSGTLDRVRVDNTGQGLTTGQGVPVSDNQNSLKAGLRGPSLLEDFVMREKITSFDHERIPERVVHARGSAAHGFFECYDALTDLTMAAPFAEAGKRTPVFVRFSTVAGERGSADTVRDVRGFAVKFYTEQGNWDLVGNNIPVFFIQDAMKFPDLVHSVKPEPHHQMPQASSAHDTFWDFVSLSPESTHMLMWVMSDRAIPRSYRTMQGFGVHTFRFVNSRGESVFVKFHWSPLAGTHALVWDEAAKITGADPDFHRRDLWESIEAGNGPQYELAVQLFTEEESERFSFDVLDPTKIVPEELVPLRPVGRMVLNRNPDNFFAETEQVAFCTQHVIPGIDFSNDPLLQGRNFSYLDTQLSRLGGPNFNEIPINSPLAAVHNNQRDGMHRLSIARGRANYEPNSLGGGCPFQAGMRGFVSFPAPVHQDKVRGKPEKFAEHFAQATLFWRSQSRIEQDHIAAAFRFELTRVQTQAVRERVLSMLANVDDRLAGDVAAGLGVKVPKPMPRALATPQAPEVEKSAALSLFARPGDGSAQGRRVALLVADGVDGAGLRTLYAALAEAGAAPRFIGARLGPVRPADGAPIDVEVSLEAMPAVLWDAVVIAGGDPAPSALDPAVDFLKEQYRHCKPILVLGDGGRALLNAAGVPKMLPDGRDDPGLILADPSDADDAAQRFIAALAKHRHFDRESASQQK